MGWIWDQLNALCQLYNWNIIACDVKKQFNKQSYFLVLVFNLKSSSHNSLTPFCPKRLLAVQSKISSSYIFKLILTKLPTYIPIARATPPREHNHPSCHHPRPPPPLTHTHTWPERTFTPWPIKWQMMLNKLMHSTMSSYLKCSKVLK